MSVVDELEVNQDSVLDLAIPVIFEHDVVGPEVSVTAGINRVNNIAHELIQLLSGRDVEKVADVWYQVLSVLQFQNSLGGFGGSIQ